MSRTDKASKIVNATPDVVYMAFAVADSLVAWLPPSGMKGSIEKYDFRTGGEFRITLTCLDPKHSTPGKNTKDSDVVEGRFVELVPNARIVQEIEFVSDNSAFSSIMKMTWCLDQVADGTEVTILCENVPEGIGQEDHEVGLESSLKNLAEYVS